MSQQNKKNDGNFDKPKLMLFGVCFALLLVSLLIVGIPSNQEDSYDDGTTVHALPAVEQIVMKPSSTTNVSNTETSAFNIPITLVKTELPSDKTDAAPKQAIKKIFPLYVNSSRTVTLIGEVGMNALEAADQITDLGRTSDLPIYLILSGPGGSVLAGNILIAAIEASKAPVYTVCVMLCASMDSMIHQYGTKRYMTDRSWIMFHPATGGAQGEVDKIYSRLKFVKRYIAKVDQDVATRQGLTLEQYKTKASIELWLDSEDAVNEKAADAIVNLLPNKPISMMDQSGEGDGNKRSRYNKKPKYRTDTTINTEMDVKWICNECNTEEYRWNYQTLKRHY